MDNSCNFKPIGILRSIHKSQFSIEKGVVNILSTDMKQINLTFKNGIAYVGLEEDGSKYVLTAGEESPNIVGGGVSWVIPKDIQSKEAAWMIKANGMICIKIDSSDIYVDIYSESCELYAHNNRPCTDFFGKRFVFAIEHGEEWSKTFASFYWDTMLPSVIEKTKAMGYPVKEGYVVSALQKDHYAGTYPNVDHEFQIKGRMAMGNSLDYSIVRRMMELQFKLMKEDPTGLWRNPCALQPNGSREYHVRRNSMDGTTNAEMLLITGNVEIIESAWLYTAATKDFKWLKDNIENLEGTASLIEECMDRYGRLWSDVYYEDEVMKDGRESLAAALAANSFKLLAELEKSLERYQNAEKYRFISSCLVEALVKPLPFGFWDSENKRFIDWVDRNGVVHDHIHLLSNILPVLFDYASEEQKKHINELIKKEFEQFQRFPSFLSARIEEYNNSEIGDGGPYDLCAAGRYWCWDAAFWSYIKERQVLKEQLNKVSAQALTDNYLMGERYDMNYVYYVDEKQWHGAAHYYEYPCVFVWVLIYEYIGVRYCLDADLFIAPKIADYGFIELASDEFCLSYEYTEKYFKIRNLASKQRTFKLDLSAIYPEVEVWHIESTLENKPIKVNEVINIEGNGEIIILP